MLPRFDRYQASVGNRTRVTSMATMYFPTRSLMLIHPWRSSVCYLVLTDTMHKPGSEPGSHQWQRCILPLSTDADAPSAFLCVLPRFDRYHASAGNRTRVTSMATMYSSTRPLVWIHHWRSSVCCRVLTDTMHQPGIEPGSHRWQRCILPLDH